MVILVGVGFAVLASGILMLRPKVMPLRPGQVAHSDTLSRVQFTVSDAQQLQRARDAAREAEPRVYQNAPVDPFEQLQEKLLQLPGDLTGLNVQQLDPPLSGLLDGASLTYLQEVAARQDPDWPAAVRRYVQSLRQQGLVLLPQQQRRSDWQRPIRLPEGRVIQAEQALMPVRDLYNAAPDAGGGAGADDDSDRRATLSAMREQLERRLSPLAAESFSPLIWSKVLDVTLATVGPTHVLDEAATAQARQSAAERVPREAGHVSYRPGQTLIPSGRTVSEDDWKLLRRESSAFRENTLGGRVWAERAGLAGFVGMLTFALGLYTARYQPRVMQNPARAMGLAAMLLAALLIAQLAGLGSANLLLLGIGPVIVVAMTLCVAYDGRFALGVSGGLALLVTLGLAEGLGFFFTMFAGLVTCCFLLGEVRSRSRLIEVGGMTGVALGGAAIVAGLLRMDPPVYLLTQGAYAALAGVISGGVVLCVLPFIERAFHITTGLTLLEYQNHPLLRRLALEAPGTYNHSLQVAAMSDEAAAAVGADSLLCRVASYYHDLGKLRKPDYFIENQTGGENRHLNLNPSVSLLVIIGHVKDGVEMAKEYGLPRAFVPFIREHHGTTLVEYFYREAVERQRQKLAESLAGGIVDDRLAEKPVDATDYRYPGPRPRSRETAIVMLADTCESACRAMVDPTPARIEARVNDLVQKRLLDGQFDECGLTLRDLEAVRRSLIKSLIGIYHGRLQYPDEIESPAAGSGPATRVTAGDTAGFGGRDAGRESPSSLPRVG